MRQSNSMKQHETNIKKAEKPCKNKVNSAILSGEGGIRTRGGPKPTSVFKTGSNITEPLENKEVTNFKKTDWAHYWALESEKLILAHPELTALLHAWPKLSPTKRQAILSLMLDEIKSCKIV